MTTDKESIRRDRPALERTLREAGAKFRGSAITCLFHEDQHPSGSIYLGEDGAWRFKCHTASCGFCGDIFDVKARLSGRKIEDVLRELGDGPKEPSRKIKIFANLDELKSAVNGLQDTYIYTNSATKVVDMVVMRCLNADSKKTFIQCRPQDGGFVMMSPPKPWPIYNRIRLAGAQKVIIVEGEKCVHALADIGIVATTSPGGAGKAAYADWKPLAGKEVYLWHDNDTPNAAGVSSGIEHMKQVRAELEKLEPSPVTMWIDATQLGLPPKGDAVEYLEIYGGDTVETKRRSIIGLLDIAYPVGAAGDLQQLIEDEISGKRRAIKWPWFSLSGLTKSLLPGTVTTLCGDPGSTKSFFLLEAMSHWHKAGEKIALYELEEDRAYHLKRCLAQKYGNAKLTDPDWVRENAAEARKAFAEHREFLDGFGRRIYAAPDNQVSLDELADWLKKVCDMGARVIGIDPITAATASEKPWIDDLKFLISAKTIMRQYGASLILVTHPRKGRKFGSGLDDLAGGAAYSRFVQTVLWIERLQQVKRVRLSTAAGDTVGDIDRVLRLTKTRNGRGAGLELGFSFHPNTLRFTELGTIMSDSADSK